MTSPAPEKNSFRITPTKLPDVQIVEPMVFRDDRGFFMESYNKKSLANAGIHAEFVQDNHSRSDRGVLRGLHYQIPPHAQGKLVRVVNGVVFDVAADVRRNSTTFGRWVGLELTAENMRMLWIPPGFAHGFLVLSETADLLYKTTDVYDPSCEQTIQWNDRSLKIEWPLTSNPILSKKDALGVLLKDAKLFD